MSDYLDPNNQELLKDFFAEARSQVDALEQNILVLENDPANRDAVDEIFRAAHTLKGGAGTVEMTELASFTHVVEDLLDAIRSDAVKVSEGVIDSLLSGIDIIKAMLDSRSDGEPYTGDTSAELGRLASFIPARKGAKSAAPAAKAPASDRASSPASKAAASAQPATSAGTAGLTEYEILEMREAAGTDRSVFLLTVAFDESNVMNTVSPIHVFAALRGSGTVLKTEPDFEKLYEDEFQPVVKYFIASTKTADELERIVSIPEVVTSVTVAGVAMDGPGTAPAVVVAAKPAAQVAAEPVSTKPADAPTPVAPRVQKVAAEVKEAVKEAVGLESIADGSTAGDEAEDKEEKVHEGRKASQQSGSILRVDSRRIDNLLNLVSETVINKATFNQISTQFGEIQGGFASSQGQFREKLKDLFDELPDYLAAIEGGRSVKEIKKEVTEKYGSLYNTFDSFESEFKTNVAKFRSTAQNLGRITSELQEGVMRIRMVPISQIFSRFPRLVRDLSKSLSKKVNLVIEGEDTELDKSVIEDLLDPLMHAVRNALDHGVENIEERKAEIGRASCRVRV